MADETIHSRRVITLRFVITYFGAIVLWYFLEVMQKWREIRLAKVILSTLYIPWFPSGLIASVTHIRNMYRATFAGYLIYLLLLCAALIWRRRWQSMLWWIFLIVLIALNVHGCRTADWEIEGTI
jgi:hypothetical protein